MIGAIFAKMKTKKSFNLLNKGDIPSFIADFAEDAVFEYPGDLEVSGKIEGKQEIRKWYENFLERFPKTRLTLRSVCVKRLFDFTGTNVICTESEMEVTNRNDQTYRYSEMSLITVRNRKVTHARDYIFDIGTWRQSWGDYGT